MQEVLKPLKSVFNFPIYQTFVYERDRKLTNKRKKCLLWSIQYPKTSDRPSAPEVNNTYKDLKPTAASTMIYVNPVLVRIDSENLE